MKLFRYLFLTVLLFFLFHTLVAQQNSSLIGPVYPPPLGVDWSGSGNSAQAGGATWNYRNIALANFDTVYWGPVNDAIRVSFNDSIYTNNEVLQFSPALSNLASGVLIWTGTTFFPEQTDTVFTRYTIRLTQYGTANTLSAISASEAGLPDNVGGLLWVIGGLDYTANFIFESSFTATSGYQPALEFFDANKPGPSTPYISFNAGFYYVNSPPLLTANNILTVDEGQSVLITSDYLAAEDLESEKAQIYFNIAPDGMGEPPHFGWLNKKENRLVAGDRFSLAEIDSNLISYTHDGGETTEDNFTFNVSDGDDGFSPAGQFLTYTFNFVINPVNDPPVTVSGSVVGRINTELTWSFSATDVDTPAQDLVFSIVENGKNGNATLVNAAEGMFSYMPDQDVLGSDTLHFQVYDGTVYSENPGEMIIHIESIPDLPAGRILLSTNDPCRILMIDPVSGKQTVYADLFPRSSNPDLLAHDLALDEQGNLFIITNDTGLVRMDYLTGLVTVLTPSDSFGEPLGIALSGSGDIFVSDMARGVIKIDSESGDAFVLSTGGFMTTPTGITIGNDGFLYVTDIVELDTPNGKVIRIDPDNGDQTVISEDQQLSDPAHVITSPEGKLFITDLDGFGGSGHVLKVDPGDGAQTLLASGEFLLDPLGIDLYQKKLYVSNLSNGSIVEIDTADGTQTVVFSDTSISEMFGICIIPVTITQIHTVESDHSPDEYKLFQNYPNPFNPVTTIGYRLSTVSQVNLSIYNIVGQKVTTLVSERQPAGRYEVTWDAGKLASGVYYYQLVAGDFKQVKKMILMK